MLSTIKSHLLRNSLISAVAAAGVAFTLQPAHAQDYYDKDDGGYVTSSTGDITVTAPRHERRSNTTGAPIETVSLDRVVYVGDLDLNTRWGQRMLRQRISTTAQTACDDLDAMYPATSSDDRGDCVGRATRNALDSVGADYSMSDY